MSAVAKLKARMSLPFETVERSEYEELIARPTQCDYNRATARSLELHLEMEALKRDAQAQLDALTEALTAASNEREAQLKAACQDDIHAAQEDKSAALEQLEALAIENAKLESICLKLDSVKEKLISKHEREIATLNKDTKAKLQKLNDKLKKAETAKLNHEKNADKWWKQFKEAEKRVTEHEATIKVIQKNTETVPTFVVLDQDKEWRCYAIHAGVKNDDKASWLTRYFRITTDHPELMHEMGTTILRENGHVELAQLMPESEVPEAVLSRIQTWYKMNKNLHKYEVA